MLRRTAALLPCWSRKVTKSLSKCLSSNSQRFFFGDDERASVWLTMALVILQYASKYLWMKHYHNVDNTKKTHKRFSVNYLWNKPFMFCHITQDYISLATYEQMEKKRSFLFCWLIIIIVPPRNKPATGIAIADLHVFLVYCFVMTDAYQSDFYRVRLLNRSRLNIRVKVGNACYCR